MQQIRTLLLEYLRDHPTGQYESAKHGVAKLAIDHGVLDKKNDAFGDQFAYALSTEDSNRLREAVRQELWLLLSQGLLVFGMNEDNPHFPWYRLTPRGLEATVDLSSQPYDPDGFLREFAETNPAADPVITSYLEEAVRAFNHGCPIAASVMLGAASEKALLLLVECFENAITDETRKTAFARSYRWTIHSKYRALKDRINQMIEARTLPRRQREYLTSEIPGAFELIRRQRNEAGHPDIYTGINSDTVYLNIRVFTEYTRCVYDLISFFTANDADW